MANRVTDLLTELVACLCAQIQTDDLPEPCVCEVVPGDSAGNDYFGRCDDRNGMAWVRLGQAYMASAVGVANTVVGNCGSSVGFDVEMGIMREVEIQEEAYTAAQLVEMTTLQHDDMLAMLKAVQCCDALDPKDFILGNYTPIGPIGGSLGGTWSLRVLL